MPGATLVPTDGLGSQVRLLLGASYDGTVSGRVSAGVAATGTVSDPTARLGRRRRSDVGDR